jgi:glutaconate CoA-transferase, subunit A
VIHAQQADRKGNVGMWGITGVQREAVLAARSSIVTVEEIVDELTATGPNHVVLPTWTVTAVAHVPRGSHPSYSMGYTTRDNAFYTDWDAISRDRDTFSDWMHEFVIGTPDHAAYLDMIASRADG